MALASLHPARSLPLVALAAHLLAACTTTASAIDAGDSALDAPEAVFDASPDAASPDAASPDAPDATPPPEVTLTQGTLRGRRGNGFREFLGIPYAAPPVGPARWRPPGPAPAWTGVRDATAAPTRCPQALGASPSGDEDCLYVNVHAPDPPVANAPVMVWIHGGGFVVGEGLMFGATRGDVLAAAHGAVVVSMNYRLGQLGFLSHPALSTEGGGASGNYGLMDQQAALRWVRDNVAAFGGDPGNVTIFGESAGAVSVCTHLVAPASAGLFHKAIAESGPCGIAPWSLSQAEAQGQRFAAALGCDTAADVAACMRAAPVADVLATLPASATFFVPGDQEGLWAPVVDGAVLTDVPLAQVTAGQLNRVPLLYGWNHDEGTLFLFLANQTGLTADQYPAAVASLVGGPGPLADQVVQHYPLSAYPSPFHAYAAAFGDRFLACPARRALLALAPNLPSAFAYYFTYPGASFVIGTDVELGAFHSAEVQFVFGHPAAVGRTHFTAAEQPLSDALMGYWARFAATGDPNGPGAVAWPAYATGTDAHLALDLAPAAGAGASAAACEFWEAAGVY